MLRQVAFLMRASKGGLKHETIMKLTWRQFQVYLDTFLWILREESEDGRKDNRRDDLATAAADSRVKAHKQGIISQAKAKLAEFAKRWGGKKGTETIVSKGQ